MSATVHVRDRAVGRDTALDVRLRDWCEQGLLTPEQAERIVEHEAAHRTPVREPLVAEALSWLGAVLVLAAVLLLTARSWDRLELGSRAALLGGGAVVLGAAGWLARRALGRDAGARARAALWLAATAAWAGLLAVLGRDALSLDGGDTGLLVAAGTVPVAAALWWVERSAAQQLAFLVATAASAAQLGARVDDSPAASGLAVWGVSAAWAVLAWHGYLQPRRTGAVAGAAGTVLAGTSIAADGRWGDVVAVLSALAVLTVAVRVRDVVLLAVGAVGTLVMLPGAVHEFWPNALAPPLALLVAGLLVLSAGLRGWRRQVGTDRRAPVRERVGV